MVGFFFFFFFATIVIAVLRPGKKNGKLASFLSDFFIFFYLEEKFSILEEIWLSLQ